MPAKILAFAGALRTGSHNKKLARLAAKLAEQAGAQVTFIDLKDFPLPIFDEDIERDAPPENARKLKDLFLAHNALIISSPEYNSSISAALKNAIDWVSRPAPNESPLQCFDGKVCLLLAASPGALGGLRGLVTLRSILGNIKVLLLPDQLAISKAGDAFNDDGTLKDPKQTATLQTLTKKLADLTAKLYP